MATAWTDYDQSQALREGWALFNLDTAPDIQKDDDSDVFENDDDALLHVVFRAREGSQRHRRALLLHIGQEAWAGE